MSIRDEFSVHMLNEQGIEKAKRIADAYSRLLDELDGLCAASVNDYSANATENARCCALVRTKLQEACFFSKRAIAVLPQNQKERT